MTHLNTGDTNTNMRSLDHADVVGAISDRKQNGLLVLLHKLDD